MSDVWVLTHADGTGGTPAWTKLIPDSPSGAPSAREHLQAVFDPGTDRMIFYGGYTSPGNCSGVVSDVWVLDHADGLGGTPTWIPLSASGGAPTSRAHVAAYDAANNRMIVHGGAPTACVAASTDTWVLSNANGLGGAAVWTKLEPSNSPLVGSIKTAGYDPATNVLTVFYSTGPNMQTAWTLSNANGLGGTPVWTMLISTTTGMRDNQMGFYDAASNKMVVFGGWDAPHNILNDTWVLGNANGSSGAPQWARLYPTGTLPTPRGLGVAAFASGNDRMIIFGGGISENFWTAVNDVWVLTSVTGRGPALSGITLSQSSVTLSLGQSVQLGATGVFEGGASRALGPADALQWSVSLGSVASVNATGLVSAVNGGTAMLTASSGTLSTSVPVSVILAPSPAGPLAAAVLGVSSISWTWTAVPDAQTYGLYRATDTASLIASTPTLAYVQTGLLPNRAYGAVYAGINLIGQGVLSAAATAYTWATPPAGTASSNVWSASATISWTLNNNPAGTLAEVQRSTDDVLFSIIFSSAALSMVDPNLIGCTTYYYRVRNYNGVGAASPFGTVWFTTLASTPSAPSSLTASPLADNRIALSWTGSVTEGITQYRLYYDNGTGIVSYASPLAVFTSTETSWTTGVLVSSAAYTFALRAKHRCGVEETGGVFASAGSTGTLADVRAVIKTPDSGKRIKGNSVTIMARLVAGTPDQVRHIVFQYRATGTQDWLNVPARNANHPNPDSDSPYFIQSDVDAWPDGSYDLRAVAVNVAGSSDTAPSAITVTVASDHCDIDESMVGGKVEKKQEVNDAVTNTIAASGDAADDPAVTVALPAGALGGSTVTVRVVSNPVISTGPPAGGAFVGSAVEIDFDDGRHLLAGGLHASLTLSYPQSVGNPRSLQIQSLDPATGQWSALETLSIDTDNRTITCATPHFSIFAVINGAGVAAPDLSRVRAYPVPYKPNSGNPDEGKPYSAGDPTSGIIFDNLPQTVSIRIFTLSGRLVAQFDTTTCTTGKIQWDAANSDGRGVASGGYFAVISSPGNKSVVKKLAVIR
jgi:hypothetical protein